MDILSLTSLQNLNNICQQVADTRYASAWIFHHQTMTDQLELLDLLCEKCSQDDDLLINILGDYLDELSDDKLLQLQDFLVNDYVNNWSHKMTQMTDNIIDRDELQEAYIESIIDGMDHKTMYQFVYDSLNGNLDDYSVEELITEVKDYYPELLEQVGVSVTYGDKMQESSW